MQSCMAPPGNNTLCWKSTWMKHKLFQLCFFSWLKKSSNQSCTVSWSFLTNKILNDPRTIRSSCFHPSLSLSLTLFPRLCPEDLNSSVLAYMTETLGYSLSEIMHTLTTNRPSAIMASYHLLLNKLSRSQKGAKASKVHTSFSNTTLPDAMNKLLDQCGIINNTVLVFCCEVLTANPCWFVQKMESNDWSLPSKNTWRERNNTESKTQQQQVIMSVASLTQIQESFIAVRIIVFYF